MNQGQILSIRIIARPSDAGLAVAKALLPGQAAGLYAVAAPVHLGHDQGEDVVYIVL